MCKTGSVSIQLKLTLLIGGAPAACVPTFSLIIRSKGSNPILHCRRLE